MVKLRAEEHRYLVDARGPDEALARRIPGSRHVASLGALTLPRQPGSLLALDRLFGPEQWEHSADLSLEVSEARSREPAAAQQRAAVTLVGQELAVECAFADKELVKLVPGYRWSAPQRRWFLPSAPMALDLLKEHFGGLLEVEEAASRLIDLKRTDEESALARAKAAAAPPAPLPVVAVPTPEEAKPEAAAVEATGEEAAVPGALLARLDRLTNAVEELVAAIKESGVGGVPAPAPAALIVEQETPAAPPLEPAADQSWTDLLSEAESDPEEALRTLSPQLQLAGEGDLPRLRALMGIASTLAGDHANALTYLRKSEEHSGVPLDPALQQRARAAYRDSVLALITKECEPARPIATMEGLEELVLEELVHDTGFDDATLASPPALDLLSFLMDDAYLRSFDQKLSDHCRVLHLVSLARGGRWMAAERVVELLRHRELSPDGFGLGLLVLANTVFNQPCMDEWLMNWPPDSSEIGFDDLRWIVANGVSRLHAIDRGLAAESALAMLALLAPAPIDVAHMDERRELVRFVPPSASARRYAEFLAGFQLAAAGHKRVTQDFPGYLQILAQMPLRTSAAHLLTVFVSDSGGANSTTRRIAEEVFLKSAFERGVADPQTEVLELLDILAESPKGDHLLNELGRGVEEDTFPGAGTFSHEHRLTLFERAFKEALRTGHDLDAVEAFDRLVRELIKHGETEALRTICLNVPQGFKPLQLPVGQALLTLQLEAGEDFEPAAESVLRQCNPNDPGDEGTHELRGLALAFPAFAEFLRTRQSDEARSETDTSNLQGKRLVVVGGHEWLRKLAMPQFDAWGLKTTWLQPEAAKNGSQALDLASGSSDLIIVNTACISHAASGRVTEQAKAANTKWAYHNSRGVGALLSIARESLADTAPPIEGPKTAGPTKHDKRRRLVR